MPGLIGDFVGNGPFGLDIEAIASSSCLFERLESTLGDGPHEEVVVGVAEAVAEGELDTDDA